MTGEEKTTEVASSKKDRGWNWCKSIVPIVVAITLYLLFNKRDSFLSLENTSLIAPSPAYEIVGSIKRITWNEFKPFVNEIPELREPIILENSVASTWLALKYWNQTYIQKHVESLPYVKKSTDPTFVLAAKREFVRSLPNAKPRQYSTTNVTTQEFMNSMNGKEFMYYFGPLDWWQSIESDLSPLEMLKFKSNDTKYGSATNVWMGHPKVTAQLHYDKSHNFFVQIHGTKRFLFFSPEEWQSMYLYPWLHVHYHQSQINWTKPDGNKYPLLKKAKAIEAIVKPGDLMYLPPYWFHLVESIDFCISTSTVSPSEEEIAFNKAYWAALPFSNSWSTKKKVAVLKIYFSVLASHLKEFRTFSTIHEFVKRALLENRYFHLKNNLKASSDLYEDLEANDCYKNTVLSSQSELPELEEKIKEVVKAQAKSLKELAPGVFEISLADYVEELASWAVGPENVVAFLEFCL